MARRATDSHPIQALRAWLLSGCPFGTNAFDLRDGEEASLLGSDEKKSREKAPVPQVKPSIPNILPFPAAKLGLETLFDQFRDLVVICLQEMKFLLEQIDGFSRLLER